MKWLKFLVIFVLGGALGLAAGGYLGYHVGASDQRIDTAPVATVIPVQEERQMPTKKATKEEPAAVAVEEEAVAAVVEEEAAAAVVEETPADAEPEAAPVEEVPAADAEPEAAPVEEAPAEEVIADNEPETTEKIEEFIISANDDSELMWLGYKVVLGQRISMQGGFANFNGKLVAENEDPDSSFVEVIIDTKSIFSENTILTGVLKTAAFFNVGEHPEIRFVSTSIEPAEDGSYTVTGNLTMKDVKHGIQFPATIERRGEDVFVKAEFTIDRKLWDVGYDDFEGSPILKEAVISFEILAEADN
ncbi:MAG: YceI family protein [Candidatus Hydrogenedentes bacterium]|jgi:polyisoprenoid-binding protein YceI|nr:YceI family protein [Candidatus Hydrogenedentota bacterium]